MDGTVRIGTAGWAIPRAVAEAFPSGGSGLARYAARLNAAEVNTTFYRPHRPTTYARWRDAVPDHFRFAVKAPRALTHEARLAETGEPLAVFIAEAGQLGPKLGPVLVQLPPNLAFDPQTAEGFFAQLRALYGGPVACEPRHASWFEAAAEALLSAHQVARVAADPARHPGAGEPGGWPALAYWRLHGSPQVYRSPYDEAALQALASAIARSPATERWCVFDNTASGAAAANALALRAMASG